ncbi:MAG: hypothetical protein GY860_06490 [Desulfobacteraceae bacterium]|nr:hypothetical protein [Desulfobacteraceae bacterium]
MNKNFKAAARENQRILEYYKIFGTNHMILSNYLQNAEIISELLTRIMDDDNRKQVLFMNLASNEEQIELLTLSAGSLKKKAGALEKKLAAMEGLSEKVKILEKEKKMLQQQIDRLKEIDLNPNPVGSKPSAE